MDKHNVLKQRLIVLLFIIFAFGPFINIAADFLKLDISYIKDPDFFRVLLNTFYESFLSVIFAFLASVIPAFYVYKKNNFISKIIKSTIFIPFFFPPVSAVIAFSLLYSKTGIMSIFNFDPGILYTIKGVVLVHVFYNSPIFVKYISEGLRSIPKNITESYKTEGAGEITGFIKIQLPYILPNIFRAFFLVFAYSFTSFSVILAIGGIKYSTIEVEISTIMRSSLDFSKALYYALIQFAVLFIINYIISFFDSYTFEETDNYSNSSEKNPVLFIISLIYAVFEYSFVFISFITSVYSFSEKKIDFSGYINLFSKKLNNRFSVTQSIFNSFFIALFVSITVVFITYMIIKNTSQKSQYIFTSGIGISSAFLSMGLLYMNIKYSVPMLLLICWGYILIAIPIAYSFMYPYVKGFDKSILEAAETDGAGKFKIFRKIEFPILFPNFVSTFFQIFVIIYGEFTIVYTMQAGNYVSLSSVTNYTLNSYRMYREASAFSSLNLMIIIIFFAFSNYIVKKNKD